MKERNKTSKKSQGQKYSTVEQQIKLIEGNSPVDMYFVDFKKINTKELIFLMKNLTMHSSWIGDIVRKPYDSDREFYFKTLEKLINVKFTDMSPAQIRINYFLDNINHIEQEIRRVLATRLNIPNVKQAKEIRRKKAQGKYFIK